MQKKVTLQTEESPIAFGGRARINKSVLEQLNVEEGNLVVVSSEDKDILVSIYSDEMIDEGKIKLRKNDLKKLKVDEDKYVEIKEHQSYLQKSFLDNLL